MCQTLLSFFPRSGREPDKAFEVPRRHLRPRLRLLLLQRGRPGREAGGCASAGPAPPGGQGGRGHAGVRLGVPLLQEAGPRAPAGESG